MRLRGIVLTLDALLALGFAAIILSVPIVLAENSTEVAQVSQLGLLGRDYLVQKYSLNKTIGPSDFAALTGDTLTETLPSDSNTWVGAVYYRYPNFFNCTNSLSCTLSNASSQAVFGTEQILGLPYQHNAWVRP